MAYFLNSDSLNIDSIFLLKYGICIVLPIYFIVFYFFTINLKMLLTPARYGAHHLIFKEL
ncbi:MAG: hypothetical protein EBS26_04290 [Bacteroidia bacterium]|nr:hypothetical protein [Bacteroidia bacterium]